ncbi:MAG: M16 family metallopeptidase [Nitrospiria bacterium]
MKKSASKALPAAFALLFLSLLGFLVFAPHSDAAALRPKRFVTENGITLLVLEQPSLPIVSVQVLVRAGAVLDPKGKAGLANITASLLEEGTTKRSAVEISETLEFMGAYLAVRAAKDAVSLRLRVLKKDIETGLDVLSDILMRPRFDGEELARVRQQILGGIRAEKDQPGAIARRAFQKLVFREHPYAHAVVGNETSVPNITRKDAIDFHGRYYHPNNTIIAVAGDITKNEIKALIQGYFGKWPRAETVFPNIAPLQPLPGKEVKKIEKDLSQATVILGHPGIHRSHPDYYPVLVMNYILGGGGFASRMMTDIRDNRGLVYSIYSHFTANALPGDFSVSFQTKSRSAKEAVDGVLRMMTGIQKTGVSDTELSEAKAYLSGSFPLKIDTTKKAAAMLASVEFHGLGLDYFEDHPKAILRVTKEDVLRAAQKYLHPGRYALVVVGNQHEIALDK